MTRDEFNEILEEIFIEGYNNALEDIEQIILDEEAYDLEEDYNYFVEQFLLEHTPYHRKAFIRGVLDSVPEDERKEVAKALVRKLGTNKYIKDKDRNRKGENLLDNYVNKHGTDSKARVKYATAITNGVKRALNSEKEANDYHKGFRKGYLTHRGEKIKKSDEKILPFFGNDTYNDARRQLAKRLIRERKKHQQNLKDIEEAPNKEKRALMKFVLHKSKTGEHGDHGKMLYNLMDTMHKKAKENNKKRNAEQEKWIKEIRERRIKEKPRTEEDNKKEQENLKKEADKFTSPETKKAIKEKPWKDLNKDEQQELQSNYTSKAQKIVPKINGIRGKLGDIKDKMMNGYYTFKAASKSNRYDKDKK